MCLKRGATSYHPHRHAWQGAFAAAGAFDGIMGKGKGMSHFDDLVPCTYFKMLPAGPLLAVGWLEREQSYSKGDPGEEFYERLKDLIDAAWQPIYFMGGQRCRLCRYDGFYSHTNLFIPGSRATYVAPEGIVHYVAVHDYCPPAEFCEAVRNCPDMGSLPYFEALRANGWLGEFLKPEERAQAWQAERRQRQIIQADGDALVARVEAYFEAKGQWPTALEEAREHAQIIDFWRYEVTGGSYCLELDARSDRGFLLRWSPDIRFWIWSQG
jgi:hypothetical protein